MAFSRFGDIPVATVFHFTLRGEVDKGAIATKAAPFHAGGRWRNTIISDPARPGKGQWFWETAANDLVQPVLQPGEQDLTVDPAELVAPQRQP